MNFTSGTIFSFSRNDTIRNVPNKFMSALSHSSTEAEIKALDLLMLELFAYRGRDALRRRRPESTDQDLLRQQGSLIDVRYTQEQQSRQAPEYADPVHSRAD
jgi:hypothetical protein